MIFSMLSMVQAASLPADAGNSIEGKNMKKILVVETNVDHYGDTVKRPESGWRKSRAFTRC